jgi:clathrin heavy chain
MEFLPHCSYELFEEAFEIYKKFGLKQQAIRVVLDHMEDLDRAHEFATKVGESWPTRWACDTAGLAVGMQM